MSDHYPYDGACTNLLKNLFYNGHMLNTCDEIHVLTNKYVYDEPEYEIIDGIVIHRVLNWTLLPMNELKKYTKIHILYGIYGGISKAIQKMLDIVEKENFLKKGIIHSYKAKLRFINAYRYDVIIPIMGTYSIVPAVSQYISKHPGPKLVIYQVDPCSSNTGKLDNTIKKGVAFEQREYANADAVITTPIICDLQKSVLPFEIYRKFVSAEFPNVSDELSTMCVKKRTDEKIICLFSGTFYSGTRNPLYTFHLLREVIKKIPGTEFHLIGIKQEDIPLEFQANEIIGYGRLPLKKAKEAIANADYLINIGNDRITQVPSKLNDYISTGKPIINICKHRNCPTLSYMEKYPIALNIFEDENDVEQPTELLVNFIRNHRNETISFDRIKKIFEECTPEYVADLMYKTFESVINK